MSSQTNPSGATLRALACLSSSTCLAVGSGGAMVETTSSGSTWSSLSSGTAYDLKAVACPSSSTCYAVGAGSTILQTTSAGSTWSWTPEYMQGTPYYYGLDGHGSVVNVTDQSGTIQNQYRYDPYGNSLARTENATIANPWQYAGGYYEAESGLYLLGVRYYDPSLGLFLQVDPLASSGLSQYAYASSDPCNNDDPSGMKSCTYSLSANQVKQIQSTADGLKVGMGLISAGAAIVEGIATATSVFGGISLVVAGAAGAVKIGAGAAAAIDQAVSWVAGQNKSGVTVSYQDPSVFGWNLPCAPGFGSS